MAWALMEYEFDVLISRILLIVNDVHLVSLKFVNSSFQTTAVTKQLTLLTVSQCLMHFIIIIIIIIIIIHISLLPWVNFRGSQLHAANPPSSICPLPPFHLPPAPLRVPCGLRELWFFVRIGPICFLARCRNRRLNQG